MLKSKVGISASGGTGKFWNKSMRSISTLKDPPASDCPNIVSKGPSIVKAAFFTANPCSSSQIIVNAIFLSYPCIASIFEGSVLIRISLFI